MALLAIEVLNRRVEHKQCLERRDLVEELSLSSAEQKLFPSAPKADSRCHLEIAGGTNNHPAYS